MFCTKPFKAGDILTEFSGYTHLDSHSIHEGDKISQKYDLDSDVFIIMTYQDSILETKDGSCIYAPAIEGCTDISAMNFLSIATSNDGSCIYAYNIALGMWNITSECEDLTISIPLIGDFDVPLADMFPETIEITGEGNGVVSLDINDNDVLADIANNGTVTIQDNQTISFDTGDFDPTGTIGMVEVDITGSGTIVTASNGDILLNLAFSILSIPADADCEITFTK